MAGTSQNQKTPITFDAFYKEQEERLKAFHAWWIKQHSEEPEHYPMEMNPGDWQEQYDIWEE